MIGAVNDVNDARGRRRLNAEIFLLPLAAVLMALVSFLTFTATWTTPGRLNLDAQMAVAGCNCTVPPSKLHVFLAPQSFVLSWRKGDEIETSVRVPRSPGELGAYTELTAQITREWHTRGQHQDASDKALDQVVLHCDPLMPYREMVAIIDAINEVQREFPGSQGKRYPALNVELVVDEP